MVSSTDTRQKWLAQVVLFIFRIKNPQWYKAEETDVNPKFICSSDEASWFHKTESDRWVKHKLPREDKLHKINTENW